MNRTVLLSDLTFHSYGSRTPSAASEASRLFINAAATPPFQGGECVRTETVCQLIPTFSALGKLSSMEQSPKGRQIQSVLPPLRGLTFWHRRPRAYALGYDLFAAARLNQFVHLPQLAAPVR